MSDKICKRKQPLADYAHQNPRLKQVEPKVDRRHEQVYHGLASTPVTSWAYSPTPSHSAHSDFKDAPVPYYGVRKTSVTDWLEPVVKRINPNENFYHPIAGTDVTSMLRLPIPSHPSTNQLQPGQWHGRNKTFITDPAVDDFTDSYAAAEQSRALRDKEGKWKPTPCDLGRSKSCSNIAECSSSGSDNICKRK